MTEQSFADKVIGAIESALPDPSGLTLDRLPGYVDRASAIGNPLEVSVDGSITTVKDLSGLLPTLRESVRSLVAVIEAAPRAAATAEQLEADLARRCGAFEKLKVALAAANREISPTTTQITAEQILAGYSKDGGSVKFTLPQGIKIGEGENPVFVAGEILNAAAQAQGLGLVFDGRDAEFWRGNEADPDLRTVPGQEYVLTIDLASLGKDRPLQLSDHGPGVPNGAIALAEACERLIPKQQGTLFKDARGNNIWVRGLTPGVALCSDSAGGVRVGGDVGSGYHDVAFASRVASRNLESA